MPNKEQYAKRREYYLEYDKKKRLTPERKEYQKKKRQTPEYKEYQKKYNKEHQEERRQSKWKSMGIICDFDAIYDIYINTHKCDHCKKEFESSFDRCLDHCHTCACVRAILCRCCNSCDRVKCYLC